MDLKGLGIIVLFVFVILGAIFATTLGDPISRFDDTHETVNESVTFAAGAAVLSHTDDLPDTLQSSVMETGSVMTNGTNSTICTANYIISPNGSIVLETGALNDLGATANVNITYSWYDELYVQHATGRILLNLVVLFFVLFVIIMAIKYFRDDIAKAKIK